MHREAEMCLNRPCPVRYSPDYIGARLSDSQIRSRAEAAERQEVRESTSHEPMWLEKHATLASTPVSLGPTCTALPFVLLLDGSHALCFLCLSARLQHVLRHLSTRFH